MALPDTALVADMEAIVANLVRKTLVHPQRCSLLGMQLVHNVAAERSFSFTNECVKATLGH